MNYGYLESAIELAEYILGSQKVPYIPYVEDGDWTPYLPKYEAQAEKFETNGCTVWGAQNQIEIFYKAVYGVEPNYSERFNYLLVPVNPNGGADPQKVYECIRKDGLVDQEYLPMTKTLDDFLDTSDIDKSLLAKGQRWLVQHDFLHEWLWTRKPENHLEILKDALKTSPIAIAVTAWYERDGLFVDLGKPNNHWCVAYNVDDTGIYVWDTYDHSRKKLLLTHNIGRAKRIWINKKTKSASRRHVRLLERILKTLQLMKPTLSDIVEKHLGTDVTPRDTTPDSVACVDVGTTIIRELYPEVPYMVSTIEADKWFSNPKNGWVKVSEPEENCIVISPTEGERIGHFGFGMADGLIASNNSFGIYAGKITKNYTWESWNRMYKTKLGLQVNLYKKSY